MSDIGLFYVPFKIPSPKPETVVLVPKSNWERLVSRIPTKQTNQELLHTAAGVFAGIAASSFIYFLSLPSTFQVWPMPMRGLGALGVSFILFLAAGLCIYAIKYLKKQTVETNIDILNEMRVLSDRFTINPEESTTPIASSSETCEAPPG